MVGAAALAHLGIHAATDHISSGALAFGVVFEQKPLARVVHQLPARSAQTLFKNRAGHPRMLARQEAGRMKLHHLHVSQREPGTQGHRQAVHGFVARRRMILVHRRPAAGAHHHAFGAHEPKHAAAHVDEQNPRDAAAVLGRDQPRGAMFLQPFDGPGKHLLHQSVDDLDTCQVALVHGAVGGLPGKRLVMQRSVGIAVKETADLIFQFAHPLRRSLAEPPRHILIRQPLAAVNRVHEMPLDAVAGSKRNIVSTLHHPRTAAFADQTLDSQGNPSAVGRTLLRMKRSEQPRAAGAKD